jgi:hypothetical protein
MATGLLEAVAGYSGAKAEYKAQEQRYKANLENAKTAARDKYDSINNRVMQENAAASQDLQEVQIDALKARSSMKVASAEGGVTGVTVDAIVNDTLAKEGRYVNNVRKNFDYQRNYWVGEGTSTTAQGQSQVNSVPRGTKPSFLPFAVKFFSNAVGQMS